jgi:ankyrin repeat protein
MAATLFGNAQMLQALIKAGADPNHAGVAGTTALMWAVPDVAQGQGTCWTAAANVNAKSESERTALLVAASYPRTAALLQLLLESRRRPSRAGSSGRRNALALAVRSARRRGRSLPG